jgi:hypothetical protein
MARSVWVKRENRVQGPLAPPQVRQLAAAGQLKPDDQVSMDRKTWHPARTVKGLIFAAPAEKADEFARLTHMLDEQAADGLAPESLPVVRKVERVRKSKSSANWLPHVPILSRLALSLGMGAVCAIFAALFCFAAFVILVINIQPFVLAAGLRKSDLGQLANSLTEIPMSSLFWRICGTLVAAAGALGWLSGVTVPREAFLDNTDDDD